MKKDSFIYEKAKKISISKFKTSIGPDIVKEGFKIKDRLISDFLNHPVTIELNNGPTSFTSPSETLGNSYGNLYSFIGFEAGTDPIKPILDILLLIDIRLIQVGDNLSINTFGFPTPQKIWDATPMPWQEGRSWAKGIEEGISGLNYYLFSNSKSFPTSKSGTAVQLRKQISSGLRFERKSYISKLLNKYKSLFKNLGRTKASPVQLFFE